jgi:hypothetical protein
MENMREISVNWFLLIFASAKRDFSQYCIFGVMETKSVLTHLTVEDILKKWPRTFVVFRNRNTACIGCLLQRFCSLQDVAETYEVLPQDLVHDFEKCIMENYPSQRSIL